MTIINNIGSNVQVNRVDGQNSDFSNLQNARKNLRKINRSKLSPISTNNEIPEFIRKRDEIFAKKTDKLALISKSKFVKRKAPLKGKPIHSGRPLPKVPVVHQKTDEVKFELPLPARNKVILKDLSPPELPKRNQAMTYAERPLPPLPNDMAEVISTELKIDIDFQVKIKNAFQKTVNKIVNYFTFIFEILSKTYSDIFGKFKEITEIDFGSVRLVRKKKEKTLEEAKKISDEPINSEEPKNIDKSIEFSLDPAITAVLDNGSKATENVLKDQVSVFQVSKPVNPWAKKDKSELNSFQAALRNRYQSLNAVSDDEEDDDYDDDDDEWILEFSSKPSSSLSVKAENTDGSKTTLTINRGSGKGSAVRTYNRLSKKQTPEVDNSDLTLAERLQAVKLKKHEPKLEVKNLKQDASDMSLVSLFLRSMTENGVLFDQ